MKKMKQIKSWDYDKLIFKHGKDNFVWGWKVRTREPLSASKSDDKLQKLELEVLYWI